MSLIMHDPVRPTPPPPAGDERHRIDHRVDVGALHADLAAAYAMLEQLDGEWAAEREWARRLRVLLALAPYATRPHLAGTLDEWVVARAEKGAPPPPETPARWARRMCRAAR